MRQYLITCLLMSCFISNSRAGEPISIGIHSSLDFCYRRLTNSSSDQWIKSIIDDRNKAETVRNGFTAGLLISKPYKQLTFETALNYASKGYRTKKIAVRFNISNPNTDEFVIFKYHYNYLDVPLKIYRNFECSKTMYRIGVGFVNSFYINNRVKSLYYDGSQYERKTSSDSGFYDYNNYHISLTASIGLIKPLNENLSLGADIQALYGVNSFINARIHGMFWNLGLNASLYYRMD